MTNYRIHIMLMGWGRLIRRGCLVSMLALAAAGCNSNSEPPTLGNATPSPMEAAMAFAPAGTQSNSRDGKTNLEDAGITDFAVVCSKTDSQGNTQYVMSKDDKGDSPYIVQYDDGRSWHYGDLERQFLKYWDFSAQDYTFYALAGYDAVKTAYPETTFSNGFVNIKGVKGHLAPADAIPPLLECHYRRVASPIADYDLLKSETAPLANGAPSAMADIVPLVFHHVMAEVQFKIYNSDKVEIPINTIKIDIDGRGLYQTAHYTAHYTAPNSFRYSDDDMLSEYYSNSAVADMKISDDKANPTTLFRFVELPQALVQKANVEITTPQGVFFGQVALGHAQNNYRWDKDMVYSYVMVVSLKQDIILVDVEVEPWEEFDEKNDLTHTNW